MISHRPDHPSKANLRRVFSTLVGIAGGVFCVCQEAHAGQLAFAPPVALPPGHGVVVVEGGDVDVDGDLDIVVAGLSGDVSIMRNLGGAVFAPPEHYTAGGAHLDLVLTDLDNDGKPDIALPNFVGSNNVSVVLNLGNGTFGQSIDYPTPGVPNPRAIGAGDLDGDGDKDLVIGDSILTTKVVLLNNGAGVFNQALPFDSGGTSIQLALGDLDGDGDLDFVSVGDVVALHRNNGNATFAGAVELLSQQAVAVAIANLDGDGDLDIVVAINSSGIHQAVVLKNNGTGTAFAQAGYEIDTLIRDIAIADLDGDGNLDIATSHVAPLNKLDILLNQGDATFVAGGAFSPGIYPQSLALGDFNGDGRKDIITANQFASPPAVGVLINTTPLPGAIVAMCFGDGSGSACPCGNNSSVGADAGCLHSQGLGGKLVAAGSPAVSLDTLVVSGSAMPNGPVLYFQGTMSIANGAGSSFGDGLLCVSGTITRLAIKFNSAGASQLPASGDPTLSVLGGVSAPGTRLYQGWYRDAAPFCAVDGFNLTNACQVVWSP